MFTVMSEYLEFSLVQTCSSIGNGTLGRHLSLFISFLFNHFTFPLSVGGLSLCCSFFQVHVYSKKQIINLFYQ